MQTYPEYTKRAAQWSEERFDGEQREAARQGYCAGAAEQITRDTDIVLSFLTEKTLRHLKKLLNDRNKITTREVLDILHKEIRNELVEKNGL